MIMTELLPGHAHTEAVAGNSSQVQCPWDVKQSMVGDFSAELGSVSQPHILLARLYFSSCQATMITETGAKQGLAGGALSKTEQGNDRGGY